MNDLMIYLSDGEREIVASELEKLFVLQDRPLSKEKKALLLEEICAAGYPPNAIVAGLKKLQVEDLRSIKLAVILDAVQEKIISRAEAGGAEKCVICDGRGIVTMRNQEKYEFVLACRCANGNGGANASLARWRGERFQESHNGLLELDYADFFLGKQSSEC